MSHKQLFFNILYRSIFAKSELYDFGEDFPADHCTPQVSRSNPPEVDSLFKRTEQVVSLSDRKSSARQRPTCPPSRSGDFPPESENLTKEVKTIQKAEKHEEVSGNKNGQKAEGRSGRLQVQLPTECGRKGEI